tara:strand:- start:224 stop:346 length:123 start_codon:yes stop_codon:yes gene_type:complete
MWEGIALIAIGIIILEVAYRVLDYMLFKVNNLKGEMDEEE